MKNDVEFFNNWGKYKESVIRLLKVLRDQGWVEILRKRNTTVLALMQANEEVPQELIGIGAEVEYRTNLDIRFDVFWKAYPKKKNRGQARKAWNRIKPSPDLLAKIILAIKHHKQTVQWKKSGGQYIPHPSTWLNAEAWDDEMEDGISDIVGDLGFNPRSMSPKERKEILEAE